MPTTIKTFLARLKGNRTRVAAFVVALLAIVEQFAPDLIPAEHQPKMMMAIAITMLILRQITTTPPGQAE